MVWSIGAPDGWPFKTVALTTSLANFPSALTVWSMGAPDGCVFKIVASTTFFPMSLTVSMMPWWCSSVGLVSSVDMFCVCVCVCVFGRGAEKSVEKKNSESQENETTFH